MWMFCAGIAATLTGQAAYRLVRHAIERNRAMVNLEALAKSCESVINGAMGGRDDRPGR